MKAPALILLAAACTGCAGQSEAPPQAELQTDHAYLVEWIGEQPLIDRSHLSLTLGSDGRAFGSGGCNHWFARYELDGSRIRFGAMGSTRRACAPTLMEQEQRFFDALEQVRRWDFSELDQLRLWPEQGAPVRLWSENYPDS